MIAVHDLLEKGRREIVPVLPRPASRHGDRRIGQQSPDQRRRPRRRGHDGARIFPKTQAEHQHVPGLGIAPCRKLVAPRKIVLRTAQPLRLIGAEQRRDRAVRPDEPPLRGFITRALSGRRDPQDAAFPFDHYVARIGSGWRDEGDAAGRPARRAGPHQFGAGPRLAKSTPCEQQPDAPLARGRQLVGPRPETPIVQYRKCLIRSQRADQFIPRDLRQRGEPAGVQALHARPPPDRLLGSPRTVTAPPEICRDAARSRPARPSCRII